MKQSILHNFHILKECQDLSLLYNYITKIVYFIVLYYYIYIYWLRQYSFTGFIILSFLDMDVTVCHRLGL